MAGGPCCILEICCDPPLAAVALADDAGIPFTAAERLLAAYRLVPKDLASGSNPHTEASLAAGRERLETLHAHIKAELREILPALGYPVKV